MPWRVSFDCYSARQVRLYVCICEYLVSVFCHCFVIAAVCCFIHVCSGTGEIRQRKRRRRAKTTELKQLFQRTRCKFSRRVQSAPWFCSFIPAQSGRIETSRIAFYVQRARLSAIPINALFRAVVSVDDAFKNPCLGLPFRPVLHRYAEFINHLASFLLSYRRVTFVGVAKFGLGF